jgi:hypothetical protein
MGTTKALGDYESRMRQAPNGDATPPARQMLLDQKTIQDATVAVLRHIPSLTYVIVSLVYAPVMFLVRESAVTSVWIAFSVQLIVVAVVFGFRALNALRTRKAYELLALKTPSSPFPTNEMIWADRLAEGRQITQYNPFFGIAELVVWLIFAAIVYLLARAIP